MAKRIGLLLVLVLSLARISLAEQEKVSRITIIGNIRMEESFIRSAIKCREGEPFSIDRAREDLRSIFGLGYFSDVQLDIKSTPQGKEIIFVVVERPSIREISIKGNEKIKTDEIREKITLKTRTVLNPEKVKENAEQIRKLYFSNGYYGVKVESKIDYLETNEAVITYRIEEGPKGRIKQITFKGNERIKSSDLKKVMVTKEWNIFSFFTKTGVLDEDILKNDVQLLTAYYLDHGYLDVKISEPKIDLSDPKRIRIEIGIQEGPQYVFGTIDFKGDVLTTKEALFSAVEIRRNEVFSNSSIRRAVNALTELFSDSGYAYVEITPETSVDPKSLSVDVTFNIDKNKKVFFENIRISGNTKTRDKVIRRELLVAEGELYSVTGLNKSRSRLRRTGYFKEVDFSTSRGSADDKINLDVKVEEAPTGSISMGVAYSSLYKVMGTVSISDRNLFGYGYYGAFKINMGNTAREFRLSFTDPYFLGYRYSVGTDLYLQTVETYETYSYRIKGASLHAGKDLTDTTRLSSVYKLENVNVYGVKEDASRYIKEQEGRRTTSSLSLTLANDERDDYFAPTRGRRHSLTVENAGGPLGGDNYFLKGTAETSWFFPMPLNTVLNLRGIAGAVEAYGGKKLPIYEKFYVGGIGTVRGFEHGMAGPVDENFDPLGAKRMVAFNSELIFPLAREIGLRGAVFWDIGKGFDKPSQITPIKTGVGIGLRWFSPVGPLNLDIGFNPVPKKGEKRRVLEFNVGTVY